MKRNEEATDEELVNAIRREDRHALGVLYNRYHKKVFHKCYSFTRNQEEAFDLAQEALMKAFDNIPSFKQESSFSTWLYTITHRHCLAAVRKKGRYQFHSIEDQDGRMELKGGLSSDSDETHESAERESIMYSLINALPSVERELLHSKYLKGASIDELESALQISGSAVKMRLKRTREKLNVLYSLALTYGLEQVLEHLELFTGS